MNSTTTPTTDLRPRYQTHESPESWTLWVEIPGCDESSVELKLEEGSLRLSARSAAPETEGPFLLREFAPRTYRRAFRLPEGIDSGRIEAKVTQGLLEVRLPKREKDVLSIPIQGS